MQFNLRSMILIINNREGVNKLFTLQIISFIYNFGQGIDK